MPLKFAGPLPATPTINVALVGPPKSGKSTGAASAPSKVLYVNCDLPTATRFARQKFGDEVVEVIYEGHATLTEVAHVIFSDQTEFASVVIDPIGELYRLLLDEKSGGAVRPSLNNYGDVGTFVERFCRSLCEAPVNAVFVCHDHPVKDEGNDEVLQLPWTGTGNPKLGRQLLGMVDVIGFTGVLQTETERRFVAQLTNNKGRPGGDRFNVLADDHGIRDVNLAEWVDVIQQSEQIEQIEQIEAAEPIAESEEAVSA